jgi:hypothetical protein
MVSRSRVFKTLGRLEREISEQLEIRRQEEERQAAEQRRWEETLTCFGAALPEDLWDRVDVALRDENSTLWRWLEDMFRGRSRMPECLTEEVMRRLVLIRLEEADRCDSFECVCLHCGLQYPHHKSPPLSEWKLAPGCSPDERPLRYDLPRFFEYDGCPACRASSRASDMNWAHLMSDGYWFERATPDALTRSGANAQG